MLLLVWTRRLYNRILPLPLGNISPQFVASELDSCTVTGSDNDRAILLDHMLDHTPLGSLDFQT